MKNEKLHSVVSYFIMKTVSLVCVLLLGVTLSSTSCTPTVALSITAEKRFLEIVWHNIDWVAGDRIIITNRPPISFASTGRNWNLEILAEIAPQAVNGWVTTNVVFDYEISRNISMNIDCYGYWVNYFTWQHELLTTGCLRGYTTWMNDLRPGIERFRISDLMIPGTHDAGSYRVGFDPGKWETPITKYSLTQDEDIKGQLMHGARYLDIRPSYYKLLPGKPFYVNHGITRQRPMSEVIDQVRDYVRNTKEFVIFGMKEFPYGFTDESVHAKFVTYLKEEFRELIIDPEFTWNATLGDLWKTNQYIFLAYDDSLIVNRFRDTLFSSVIQRWGDVQTWKALEDYLRGIYMTHEEMVEIEKTLSRPKSDMAQLTPNPIGVALDIYGGLRRMADNVNSGISDLYRNELGTMANIVAVDYLRGTTVADLAVELNKNKINET